MTRKENYSKAKRSRLITGSIFVILGTLVLLKTSGLEVAIPEWMVSWPALLFLFGLYIGIKHKFRHSAAYFLIGIGGAFLIPRLIPGIGFSQLIIPAMILASGFHLLFNRRKGIAEEKL